MSRIQRLWENITAPWLAPLLRQVVLCRALVGMVLVLGGANLLGYSLWPCVFAKVTGLPCPGCGMTRAATALLRGEWRQAMAFHPFAPGFVLLGALLAVCSTAPRAWREATARLVATVERATRAPTIFLFAAVIYGLLRMGGICSNHAPVKPLPFMSQHFGLGQRGGKL